MAYRIIRSLEGSGRYPEIRFLEVESVHDTLKEAESVCNALSYEAHCESFEDTNAYHYRFDIEEVGR